MQPYIHAQASARQSGRSWQDDLEIHEFLDLAKHACPDLRHRLLLHNSDLGPELAAMAFPDRTDAREIALMHVRQDLGWEPSLAAWLEHFDPGKLPRAKRYRDAPADIVQAAADHFRLSESTSVQMVWDMLMLPTKLVPDCPTIAEFLLFNSVGPILTRAVFGPPRSLPKIGGGDTIVDFSWIAEGMIVSWVGAIHSLETVLRGLDGHEPKRTIGSA